VKLEDGSYQEAPFGDCGWGNPMGGLYTTARDMSRYISFLFRDNVTGIPDQPGVLIDGVSVRQFFTPAMSLPDGRAAFV
jgi:CubicO group peptidase (beta-lactamase class C family)